MRQYKILIADDDMDYLFQMSSRLTKMGFTVITAESQREAEQILGEIKPDLCIFDLMMESDDSGFVLCHKLRNLYQNVPAIIATAVASETGIQFDIEEGDESWIKADLIIDKGIRTDHLEKEIRKLLKLS